jgi:DNA-binding NtrC family response regulator
MRGNVLIVDDDREMCAVLREGLSRRGYQTADRTTAADAFALLGSEDFDAVVTDLNMKGMNGAELCERIAANRPDTPVIVITAFGSLETAIAAIRAGAYDFVTKPFDLDQIALALERAVRFRRLTEEVKRLRTAPPLARPAAEGPLAGESAAMESLRSMIGRIAQTDATVLLVGETGAGKELTAREIHAQSRRREAPLIVVNCAAVPENLLESELFGHVKGAFTDAKTDRKGLFLMAQGGTIFLDEVGDMPASLQPKLLRALQERRIRPVGADTEVPVDVRVIAATNRDPETLVAEGRLREDLFFRLNVIRVDIPPLRARGNDALLLAQRFIQRCSLRWSKGVKGLSPAAAGKLLSYSWPGNVRELENCIERAVAVTRFEELTVEDLPEKIRSYSKARLPLVGDDPEDLVPLDEVERRYIRRVLEAVGGNRTEASRILGVDRKTLYRKLKAEGEESEG